MRFVTVLIVVVFLLTGCGKNDFEKSISAGKEALKETNYKEATKQFSLALIEKPTDKDAIALMQRADSSLTHEKLNQNYS